MVWLILAILIWGCVHSVLASLKIKTLVTSWLGERRARFYRLGYNLLAGVSFLPILILGASMPDRRLYSVPLPWSVVMMLGEFLAVSVLLVTFLQTGISEFIGLRQIMNASGTEQQEGTLATSQGGLVSTGTYRFVRHPLYTAGLVFIWLTPVMTVNLLIINISLSIYIFIGAYFEERKLRKTFGREYSDYAAHTPMFIPFLKGNKPLN